MFSWCLMLCIIIPQSPWAVCLLWRYTSIFWTWLSWQTCLIRSWEKSSLTQMKRITMNCLQVSCSFSSCEHFLKGGLAGTVVYLNSFFCFFCIHFISSHMILYSLWYDHNAQHCIVLGKVFKPFKSKSCFMCFATLERAGEGLGWKFLISKLLVFYEHKCLQTWIFYLSAIRCSL